MPLIRPYLLGGGLLAAPAVWRRGSDVSLPANTVARLDIGSGEVGATLTDFPVRVLLEDMPALFWSEVAANGSDIRVTDSDGVQLPIDLVTINTSAQTGFFLFKDTLVSTGQTFYVQAGSGAAAVSVGDPIGRNAVWSAYHRVFIYYANEDRTGSGITTSLFNSATVSAGQLNTNPTNAYAEISCNHSDDWTLSFLPEDGANQVETMITYRNAAGNDSCIFYNRGQFDGSRWRTSNFNGTTETFNTSYAWTALDTLAFTRAHYLAMGRDNLFESLYADGELRSSATAGAQRPTAGTRLRISFPISDAHRGFWNCIFLRFAAPEEHWMRAEFRNWSERIWLDSFGGVGAYDRLYTVSTV